jgi:hypothetical protein
MNKKNLMFVVILFTCCINNVNASAEVLIALITAASLPLHTHESNIATPSEDKTQKEIQKLHHQQTLLEQQQLLNRITPIKEKKRNDAHLKQPRKHNKRENNK